MDMLGFSMHDQEMRVGKAIGSFLQLAADQAAVASALASPEAPLLATGPPSVPYAPSSRHFFGSSLGAVATLGPATGRYSSATLWLGGCPFRKLATSDSLLSLVAMKLEADGMSQADVFRLLPARKGCPGPPC